MVLMRVLTGDLNWRLIGWDEGDRWRPHRGSKGNFASPSRSPVACLLGRRAIDIHQLDGA